MSGEEPTRKRTFTFAEAAALLPEVRRLTGDAQSKVEALRARIGNGESAEPLQAEADAVFQAWAESMHLLGIEVKGVWLIDFDNGSGYYCWIWPETRLDFYHSYDDGFGGRMRIH